MWEGKIVLNVHSVQHVAAFARIHGPLWTWWAFPHEDKNHYLSEVTHATRKPEKQMFLSLNLLTSFPFLMAVVRDELHLSEADGRVSTRIVTELEGNTLHIDA